MRTLTLPKGLLLASRQPALPRCLGAHAESCQPRGQAALHKSLARSELQPCRAISADPQQQEVESLDEAKQIWGKRVREGKVKSTSTKNAGDMIKNDWTLLDVRPQHEVETAGIEGAVTVPLFVVDEEKSIGTLIKKATAFGMGGWWEGGTHMIPNRHFLRDVDRKISKDSKVIVPARRGSGHWRHLSNCQEAGYRELAWINGGFETAKKGDLPVTGADDVRLAGIGGLSKLLGWTEVQQETSKGFFGGSNNLIKLAILVIVADALLFVYEQGKFLLEKGQ